MMRQQAGVIRFWPHPDEPEVIMCHSGADIGEIMAELGGSWSPVSAAWLLPANMLDILRRRASARGLYTVAEALARNGGSRPNPSRSPCPTHGDNHCPPGVPFGDWAGRFPEEAREFLDGIDAIKARSRIAKGGTP